MHHLFDKLVAFIGKEIEIRKTTDGRLINGKLSYVMPDSLIVTTSGGPVVVAMSDITAIDPQSSAYGR